MSFIRRLINLVRDEQLSRDIDREMAFHLREHVEALVARGMSERDAIREAQRRFGNRTLQSESTRDADIVRWLDSVRGDVRYAMRALRRSPVFTAVAIASLALGIGANTAIYSLLDAVVVRALPVPNPEELVTITTGGEERHTGFSNPLWEALRDRQTVLASVAAFGETTFNAADGGEIRPVRGEWVSGDYFRVFGMRPAAGRLLTAADDVRGCPPAAVLGHGFWQSEYGGRADAVGRNVVFEGKPLQIVGVAAPGFAGPEVGREIQVYVPICAMPVLLGRNQLDMRTFWWLRVMGRRDPSVTLEQVRAGIGSMARDLYAATMPAELSSAQKAEYANRTMSAFPGGAGMSDVRDRYSTALKVMMGAVALVLLIACANVANLLLARATARQREVAVRLAIGAARERLVRQLLTESALLAIFGAAAGLLVARWGTQALVTLIATRDAPVALDLSLNLRVLGFTALVATVTTAVFGLVPAWRGTRVHPQAAMKAGARGVAEGHTRFTLGKALVVAQVALSLTLLVGAGLLVGSLRNLRTMDPGFTSEGVLLVSARFGRTGMTPPAREAAKREALLRIRALPGVRSAGTSDVTPVGRNRWNDALFVDGFTPASERDAVVWFNEVSDGFFATLDTRFVAGRDFDASDTPQGPKTAIVNQSVAKKFFGDASPLGKQFRTKHGDTYSPYYTIVGVVEDSKYSSLREETSGTAYIPVLQNAAGTAGMTTLIRAEGDPLQLVGAVKRVFADVHRLVGLDITTMDEQVARSLRREHMLATLSATFGAVALALSMLGLYGVMAYTVARRRNEIGVRIALGADQGRLLRMVLWDVVRVVTIGLVLGVGGAMASGKLVTSFLFGVSPTEPAVMAGAALLLLAVAVGSGLFPAIRAARVDPVAALRED
jgi:putative ABC transport system permease protein